LIVADVGGPAEIVKDGCGLRVAVTDEETFVDDLKQAILTLALDEGKRRRLALKARRLIEEEYDQECLRKKGERLYDGLLKDRPYAHSSRQPDNQNALA
jgi:glycosyltransferase involved in cell wall biosynthesis